ncbi:hypothetical protein [Arcobacter sp. LA11]|uniref:hypothetical protein n=1 Tax=Arcobacter sp. LA11 TaxID=1898176 RepID=UPI000933DF3A|nr:hypothetical protein [Arcobacter sp. LA11]
MSFLKISSIIKFFGSNFFIWSMPLAVIILNIFKGREIFETNVLIGLVMGLLINFIWDMVNTKINKKEYHKNLL